jgi:putative acetyltransferase
VLLAIRSEIPADIPAIYQLNAAAFHSDAEARLVDALRANGALLLSLVAEADGELVGHIGFSPVVIDSQASLLVGVGLAPLAVAPRHQRQGVGGKLIEEGLRRLRTAGHRWCVVLGHANYYPRYGFVLARTHGIRWEKPVPDNIFFVQALTPNGLDGVAGTVRYRPEFDAL